MLDFYCPAAKLAIEVDGASHSMGSRPQRDASRDGWLKMQGVRTIRFPADEVLNNMDGVIRMILSNCSS